MSSASVLQQKVCLPLGDEALFADNIGMDRLMVDLLTYINVNLLGVKPFHLNFFKSGIIIFCILTGVWLLASKAITTHAIAMVARLNSMGVYRHRVFAWSLGSIFTAFLVYLRFRQYFELQTMWDMAVEANVAWHMVHGPWFFNSLDNTSFLGGHFSPVFLLIGLVYRLIEHPLTLLVIQSVAFGLGAVAVYYLALLRCHQAALALLAVALYMVNPYIHHSNAHDFHMSPLAIPSVLWMFVFIESGKQGLAATAAVLAFSVEESILLPLAGFGLYLVAFRPGWRIFGVVLATCAVAYFCLIIKVLFPIFSPNHGLFFWDRYANLGTDLNDALLHLLGSPLWAAMETLVSRNQYVYLLYFLIPVAFLPLFSWREACLIAIPLSIMFLSQNSGMNKLGFHYSAPTLPFLFFGVVHGLARVARFVEDKWLLTHQRWSVIFAAVLFMTALNTYRSPGYDIGATDPKFSASAFQSVSLVPSEASVATDVRFAPLLINRHHICKIGAIPGVLCDWTIAGGSAPSDQEAGNRGTEPRWVPEYVLIGLEPGNTPIMKVQQHREYIAWLTTVQGYEEISTQNGIMLFHRENSSRGDGK